MKRVVLYLFVCGFIVISTGCANKSLQALKELEKENQKGLIVLYDEALERQYLERKSVESQLIDLQSEHTFLINSYIKETGLTPDQLENKAVFSIAEIKAHKEAFHKKKIERWKEIDLSYEKIKTVIEEKKNPKIEEEVERIEEEREDTKKSFFSGIKNLWGILK